MTLRDAMACVAGIGSFLLLGACATASPVLGDGRAPLRDRAGGYELQVLVDGVPAPTFTQGGGTYVLGQLGQRYTLRVVNHSGRRIEAVLSVDGRDVVDGRPADFRSKRGYLVPAWGEIDIDGWRLSNAQAAAFRFSTVADSYAGRTGSAREVGVIGAAIFPERIIPRPLPPRPLELPPIGGPPWSYRDGRGMGPPAPSKKSADDSARAEAAPEAAGAVPRSMPAPQQRPGLGTEFGEAVSSPVQEVPFMRANPTRPALVLGVRYNDRAGLVALGIDVDGCHGWAACDGGETALRETANPFPVVERRYAAPPPCWNGRGCSR